MRTPVRLVVAGCLVAALLGSCSRASRNFAPDDPRGDAGKLDPKGGDGGERGSPVGAGDGGEGQESGGQGGSAGAENAGEGGRAGSGQGGGGSGGEAGNDGGAPGNDGEGDGGTAGGSATNTAGSSSTGGSGGEAGGAAGTGGTSAGAGGTGDGGAPPASDDTVYGRIINQWQHPIPAVTVMIGSEQTQTNALGEFEIPGVDDEYDVFLDVRFEGYDDSVYGWVFQGLTRRDPTLQIYNGLKLNYGRINVTPTNYTEPSYGFAAAAVGGEYGSGIFWSTNWDETGFYWFGPPQTTVKVHGLQWEAADGVPTNFIAYAETGPVLFDRSSTDYTDVALDFSREAVPSNSISGTVNAATYDNRLNSVYVRFSSNAVILIADEEVDATPSFTYTVPSLPDSSIIFAAHEGWHTDDARAVAWRTGVGPGTSIDVTVPISPTLNGPAPDSTLGEDTVFSWNSSADTFVWYLLADDYYEGIYVVTTQSQVMVPTFPNGLQVLREASEYFWRVETHDDFASVDEMAGPQGFIGDYNWFSSRHASGPKSADGTFTASETTFIYTP